MAEAFAFSHVWEQPSGLSWLVHKWAHHSSRLLELSVALTIALGFRTAAPTMVDLIATLALVAFVLITFVLFRSHNRRLCESCASAIPLNAAEQGERYRRRFAVAHASTQPKLMGAYLIVLFGSNALLLVPDGRYGWALVQASMIYLISSHATHRRLQPWCPQCAGGDGGFEQFDEAPDLPRGGRLLV
ncbi:hypothetical protein M6D93_07320 [Jatrophihabitans telluris]|uniref:Methylamine utilization protein MauE n=1 Tax=Jatrophihabitans telluris TaxID=2038343 RepID=A0ABY4R1Y0_9ACTN|nr:hypothetical protein [Jatrophihabitans telluris]UQX89804.1 hypothetical protein M6D93_07320 [Jatrophihabitans telluris]